MVHYAPTASPPNYQPTAQLCQAAIITDPCRHHPDNDPPPRQPNGCRASLTVFPPPNGEAPGTLQLQHAFLPLAHIPFSESRAEGTWHFAH